MNEGTQCAIRCNPGWTLNTAPSVLGTVGLLEYDLSSPGSVIPTWHNSKRMAEEIGGRLPFKDEFLEFCYLEEEYFSAGHGPFWMPVVDVEGGALDGVSRFSGPP